MQITKDIHYIGVNDHQITHFEGQFEVPNGMAYNSYVILDEKIAVMDTVETHFGTEWLNNLSAVLAGRTPDYLVVQHMEPDHSANIIQFMSKFPNATVVASQTAFRMMQQFYGSDYANRRIVVGDGDTLSLGRHKLTFLTAPMVHWPEVIVTYDQLDKVLFSADSFGKFGALDVEEDDWACEARRYYFGIVGKFGAQVQALLKKAAAVEIRTVCPLHGPALNGDALAEAMRLYDIWSSYGVESEGVMIAYTSVYGNTKKAVESLAQQLRAKGCPKVVVTCLQQEDWAEAVEDAFRYGKLVLATTTYNGHIFPAMKEFIDHLTERNYQNRTVAFIENGSWAPTAGKEMRQMLEGCKNLTLGSTVTLRSAMTFATLPQLDALAEELLHGGKSQEETAKKGWVCGLCGYVYEGETLPEGFACPVCHAGAEKFEPLK